MALWGNKDRKGLTGVVSIENGSTAVVGLATEFTTELSAGQTLFITGGEYRIASITDDTNLTLEQPYESEGDLTEQIISAGEQPAYIPYASMGDVYGVDCVGNYEAQVNADKGLNTPGWVKYVTYTDCNGNVRHKSEVLVAMSSIQGDAADDAVLQDD